jgi:hypothetical protein
MKAFALALLFSLISLASSPFNGAWLTDIPSAIQDSKPETFLLSQGKFTRGGPKSRVSVKADGRFHFIGRDDYVDEVSVSILGPRKIREHNRLNGKLAYSIVYTVSPDATTMARRVTDYSKPSQRPISTTINYRRLGALQKSATPISGEWLVTNLSRAKSDLIDVLELNDGRFSLRGAGGQGYDAEIGGPPVPMAGDAASARAAVSMPDDKTIIVNMSLGGMPTVTMTMTMQPDGRTIKVAARRLRDGSESNWLMLKQQD